MGRVEAVLTRLRVEPRVEAEPLLRTMMLCYLVDWKAALELGRQITPLHWTKLTWGPYAADIIKSVLRLSQAKLAQSSVQVPELGAEEGQIIDGVFEKYREADIKKIFTLVKSTYPILYDTSNADMDLVSLARVYKEDFAADINEAKEQEKALVSFG